MLKQKSTLIQAKNKMFLRQCKFWHHFYEEVPTIHHCFYGHMNNTCPFYQVILFILWRVIAIKSSNKFLIRHVNLMNINWRPWHKNRNSNRHWPLQGKMSCKLLDFMINFSSNSSKKIKEKFSSKIILFVY